MKRIVTVLALLLGAAVPAVAQPEPSASEIAAVRELLEVSRTRENFIRAMELGMEQGGMGEMTPEVRRVLREFMDEHFRYDEMEPEFIQMYAELYTEDEIRGMTAFYRTPLGQRMIETLPELSAASQSIVQQRLQAVMPELIQRIMQAMQEPAPRSRER
ncbi:MAG: DUF2059 domain-containing protein [Gemmatimonadetes bacterium]|nr:DUF2059 domain-containing protein [Gemmatimonadota bacterium]